MQFIILFAIFSFNQWYSHFRHQVANNIKNCQIKKLSNYKNLFTRLLKRYLS